MAEVKEKMLNGVRFVNTKGAANILGISCPCVNRLVRVEKAAAKAAERAHKARTPDGIPFYQATAGADLWFPVDGLAEFIRRKTFGLRFAAEEK